MKKLYSNLILLELLLEFIRMVFNYLIRKINWIKKVYKRYGFITLFKKTIYQRHVDIIISEKILSEIPLFKIKNRLEIVPIQKRHLDILNDFCMPYDLYERDPKIEFNEYFKNGCEGFLAKLNGNIIGYQWWGKNDTGTDFRDQNINYLSKTKMKKEEVYLFDYFLNPKYRGGGNAIAFSLKVFSILKNIGYQRALGSVDADNRPARWSYKITGCIEIKRVSVHRLFLFIVFRGMKLSLDGRGHKKTFQLETDIDA